MKYTKASYEILEQEPGIEGIFKQVERAGRTCYKSEDKITEDSAEGFVQRMIDSKHYAMLEHGTVYLYFKTDEQDGVDLGDPFDIKMNLMLNEFTVHKTNFDTHESFYTTNLRVLVENFPDDWRKIIETHAVDYDERFIFRPTVKLVTNIHVYKDLTRHRKASFAIESTRYCNYTKEKFGGEITFIEPCWKMTKLQHEQLTSALRYAETYYKYLLESGFTTTQAAEVLPQATKADVIITSTIPHWEHMFDLRAKGTTGKPHPEVEYIMRQVMNEFIQRGWMCQDSTK